MSTRRTKSFAKINNNIKCKPYNWFFHQKRQQITVISEILSVKIYTQLPKIGNFVSKNKCFSPFSALAKNLTISGRPNERTDEKSQGRPFDRLRDLNNN